MTSAGAAAASRGGRADCRILICLRFCSAATTFGKGDALTIDVAVI
jgi:hypothetical protein